jgi:site-specific DNA recombinase
MSIEIERSRPCSQATNLMKGTDYRVVDRDGRRVLEVNPDEAALVRDVVRQYLNDGAGFKSIAKGLRERGIASRRGAGWSFTSVRSLLLNPPLTGKIRFNLRKMQLNRTTGRRVARHKEDSEHLERQDESLRILDDETFAQVQARIGRQARGESTNAPRGMSLFTGLVFCQCGARCYKVHSENKKGSYNYYVCGRHLRYGDCPNSARIREDSLSTFVRTKYAQVFDRADEIISGLCEAATEAMRGNRSEADRIKREIATLEKDQERMVELLMDRDIAPATKQAVNRKGWQRSSAKCLSRQRTIWRAQRRLRSSMRSSTDLSGR